MKKTLLPLLLVIMSPLISGCQDKEHSVISIKTYDDSFNFVEVTPESVTTLINSGQHFALECYTTYCSHCNDLEPLLRKYSKENDNVIYRIDLGVFESSEQYKEVLTNPFPDIFKHSYVPQILYIKDNKLTYEVSDNKFSSYTALNKIMNKHMLSSNITMVNSLDALKEYENKNKNYVAYLYDLENKRSLDLAAEQIITSKNASAKKNLVLLNKAGFAENFAELQDYFNTDNIFFASYKNESKIKTIDYSDDDGSKINELISNL